MPRGTSPCPKASRTSTASTCAAADLSIGTYCIPVGGKDGQDPHTADEIYVVLRGRARLVSATGEAEVGPGSVIFLPAGEEHSFADVTEDLSVLVVFGPSS